MAYSQSRKADRVAMAKAVAALALARGAKAEIVGEGARYRERRTSVDIKGAHGVAVSVDFDGSTRRSPESYYVLSWYGAERRLDPMFAQTVNSCHGHKATDVAWSFEALCDLLEERLEDLASGRAFA